MGKQINYYMEYASFVQLAEKALALGCEIIREEKDRSVTRGFSASLITEEQKQYYFHVPEAGEIAFREHRGVRFLDTGYSAGGASLIEAGYSYIVPEEQRISRARLYCISGYYDENGAYIARPDCVTKVYQALARFAKKLAPYTELTDIVISTQDETYLQEIERRHKEYITGYCRNLRESGYQLK